MLRLSPRLAVALLWCAIALLPLRGLAASWMAGEMAFGTGVAGATESAMPCHAAPPAPDDTGTASPHLCTACDLCHAGVTVPPAALVLAATPLSAAPDEALPSHHGRVAPDGLFRPPR